MTIAKDLASAEEDPSSVVSMVFVIILEPAFPAVSDPVFVPVFVPVFSERFSLTADTPSEN